MMLTEVPGLGLSALAARSFNTGEVVLQERPVITFDFRSAPLEVPPELPATTAANFHVLGSLAAADASVRATLLDHFFCPDLLLPHPTVRAASAAAVLAQDVPALAALGSPETITRLLLVCAANAHSSSTAHGEPCGALFPTACRVAHSCAPNVVHQTLEGEIVLQALRPIAAGEVLGLCYTDWKTLARPVDFRRRVLWETKMFTCHCARCDKEEKAEASMSCPACPGRVTATSDDDDFPWQCGSCGGRFPEEAVPTSEADVAELCYRWENKDEFEDGDGERLAGLADDTARTLGPGHWAVGILLELCVEYHGARLATALAALSSHVPSISSDHVTEIAALRRAVLDARCALLDFLEQNVAPHCVVPALVEDRRLQRDALEAGVVLERTHRYVDLMWLTP